MSDEIKQTYYVEMSKEGRNSQLENAEVIVGVNDPGIRVDPSGALIFVLENQEVVIYAPGMWAMVTGGGIE